MTSRKARHFRAIFARNFLKINTYIFFMKYWYISEMSCVFYIPEPQKIFNIKTWSGIGPSSCVFVALNTLCWSAQFWHNFSLHWMQNVTAADDTSCSLHGSQFWVCLAWNKTEQVSLLKDMWEFQWKQSKCCDQGWGKLNYIYMYER